MPLIHEAEGVYRLAVHTPLPVEPTNVYFLVGERLGLFDTGIGVEHTWREVVAGLRELGARPDDVDVVVISHAHVDHHGLVDRFPRAEVLVGGPDVEAVADVRGYMTAQLAVIGELLGVWGVPAEWREQVGSLLDFADFARLTPAARAVDEGAVVDGFGSPFVVVAVPGHTSGHICLLREVDGVLLAGDHLLPTISPNPALYTEATPVRSGLGDYIRSLRRLLDLDIRLVLPGHGEAFAFSEERIAGILGHHERRLIAVRELVSGGSDGPSAGAGGGGAPDGDGVTVFEVASGLFPQRDFFEVFLGLREALGHLEVLRDRGEVVRRRSEDFRVGSPPSVGDGAGSVGVDLYSVVS